MWLAGLSRDIIEDLLQIFALALYIAYIYLSCYIKLGSDFLLLHAAVRESL
jgi:hypothetical protein